LDPRKARSLLTSGATIGVSMNVLSVVFFFELYGFGLLVGCLVG